MSCRVLGALPDDRGREESPAAPGYRGAHRDPGCAPVAGSLLPSQASGHPQAGLGWGGFSGAWYPDLNSQMA